jgi:hypothetical protein
VIELATRLEGLERVTLAFLVAGAATRAGKQMTSVAGRSAERAVCGRF